jgi:phage shock protein A
VSPARKKRAKKGIESLEGQIKEHTEKLERAYEEGRIELASYYVKEIHKFKKNVEKKKKAVRKR